MMDTSVANRRSKRTALALTSAFWGCYLAIIFLTGKFKAMAPAQWGPIVWGLISSALIVAMTLLFLRREGRSVHEIGVAVERASFRRLLLGLGIGVAVFGLNIVIVVMTTSALRFERVTAPSLSAVIIVISGVLALSCMEELGFRAYTLRTPLRSFKEWQAHAIVAAAFGLCHIAFGWSWSTVLLGVIPSALLFSMAAVASGGLALPIGIHAGLNIARWAIGDTGIWRTVADPKVASNISIIASFTGIAITLLASLVFWCRIPRHPQNADVK